ncbi:MAG: class I SAM-dependent methyltransferase [Minisyncoccia bacterium]
MLNLFNKVNKNIAKEDNMYHSENKDHYFGVGESALKNIIISLDLAKKDKCLSILDMPSGYGRVLRYLKANFPDAKITACELEKDAVDFCVNTFGAKGLYSDKDIKNLKIEDKFDLIWCGSLFTHLDENLWLSFLNFFYDHLNEKGVLIFTTHGRYVVKRMTDEEFDYGIPKERIPNIFGSYIKSGFGYENYPNSEDYGISISSFSWIYNILTKFKDFKIVLFSEKSWDNHQDVIACIKEK